LRELLDLGPRHPVVLVVVEDGQQRVEMVEPIRETQLTGQAQADVAALAPTGNFGSNAVGVTPTS
jgi:hypothetical protein